MPTAMLQLSLGFVNPGAPTEDPQTPTAVDLASYDLILINTSGGKDSAVTAWVVAEQATAQGVFDRCLLVHATFPEEWPGTVDVVKLQAEQVGLPLEVVTRGESLLDYVSRRGKWPSAQQRYCTSEWKRGPIDKVITRRRAPGTTRHARVVNVMGIRAEESPARAKKAPFRRDERRSNDRRHVDEWFPVFDWPEAAVWALINTQRIPMHPAYGFGMRRLSCMFCIFASRADLLIAGRLNPAMLAKHVAVEAQIGHSFRQHFKIAEIAAALAAEAAPAPALAGTP